MISFKNNTLIFRLTVRGTFKKVEHSSDSAKYVRVVLISGNSLCEVVPIP